MSSPDPQPTDLPCQHHADFDVYAFREADGRAIVGLGQLNILLRALVASWQTFERSQEQVTDLYVLALFHRFADERRTQAAELVRHIIRHGGEPEVDSVLLAELNCVWLQLRAALFLGESDVILDQVRADEDALLRLYDEAIASPHSAAARRLLDRHRHDVLRNRALVCDMRATYRPAI